MSQVVIEVLGKTSFIYLIGNTFQRLHIVCFRSMSNQVLSHATRITSKVPLSFQATILRFLRQLLEDETIVDDVFFNHLNGRHLALLGSVNVQRIGLLCILCLGAISLLNLRLLSKNPGLFARNLIYRTITLFIEIIISLQIIALIRRNHTNRSSSSNTIGIIGLVNSVNFVIISFSFHHQVSNLISNVSIESTSILINQTSAESTIRSDNGIAVLLTISTDPSLNYIIINRINHIRISKSSFSCFCILSDHLIDDRGNIFRHKVRCIGSSLSRSNITSATFTVSKIVFNSFNLSIDLRPLFRKFLELLTCFLNFDHRHKSIFQYLTLVLQNIQFSSFLASRSRSSKLGIIRFNLNRIRRRSNVFRFGNSCIFCNSWSVHQVTGRSRVTVRIIRIVGKRILSISFLHKVADSCIIIAECNKRSTRYIGCFIVIFS